MSKTLRDWGGQGRVSVRLSFSKTRYTYNGSLYTILSTTFIINLDSDSAWVQVPLFVGSCIYCAPELQLQSHAYI